MWADDAKKRGEDEEEDEEEDDEEDLEEDAGPSNTASLTREERKKEKKAKKEAAIAKSQGKVVQVGDLPSDSDEDEDDMLSNPNHSTASRNQASAPSAVAAVTDGVKDLKVSGTPSRRERESMEAQQAKERYRKLHESGKTDEAKADLARLKIIREKREAEAARKQVNLHYSRP
jgi:hypothetical protein